MIQSYGGNALQLAQAAAQSPYGNLPVQPVAGFSPDQQTAFGETQAAQGMAQPYFGAAGNLIAQNAAPNISQYYGAESAGVFPQLENIFGQQAAQNTGSLVQAAGGVGADRIAVGQGNLANQQALAAGQTLSGIYGQAANQALGAAQLGQSAGFGLANVGAGAQNAQLQGIQALLGTGGLQQQLAQAQLNAPYNWQMQQFALPYQNAQFLAGITGGLAPAFGGTTQGQTTYPGPSLLSQLLGGGLAAGSLIGGLGQAGWRPSFLSARGGAVDDNPFVMDGHLHDDGIYYADGGAPLGDNPFASALVPDIPLHPGGGQGTGHIVLANPPQQQNPFGQAGGIGSMVKGLAALSKPSNTGLDTGQDLTGGLDPIHARGGHVFAPHYDDGGDVDEGYDDGGSVNPFDMAALMGEKSPLEGGVGLPEQPPAGGWVPQNMAELRAGLRGSVQQLGNVGSPMDWAMAMAGGPRARAEFPPGYFDAIPQEMRLSGKGVSHPGFRWQVVDGKTNAPVGDAYSNSIRASRRVDALDNQYGAVRYRKTPVRATPEEMTDAEHDTLRNLGIALPTQATGGRVGYQEGGGTDPLTQQALLDYVARTPRLSDATGYVGSVDQFPGEGTLPGAFSSQYDANVFNPKPAGVAQEFPGGPEELPPEITHPGGFGGDTAEGLPQSLSAYSPVDRGVPPSPDHKVGFGEALGKLGSSPWMAGIAAGLGIMGGTSPFALTNIGQGGLQGVKALEQQRQDLMREHGVDIHERELALKRDQFDRQMKLLQLQNLNPVKIGQNVMGQEIYGVRDPKSGQIIPIDPNTGNLGARPSMFGSPTPTVTPSATGTTPTPKPSAEDSAALPPGATLTAGDIPANVRPEVLQELDPQIASQVKALSEGRMAFPSGFALKSPYWQHMIQLVSMYDPSFDAVNYNARAKTRGDFTSGVAARNITSLNTVMQHVDEFAKAGADLNNWKTDSLGPLTASANALTNWYRTNQQDPRITRFNVAANAISNELEKAFRGSTTAIAGIKEWHNNISPKMSPEEMQASTQELMRLLGGRMDALADQYNRGMGTTKDGLTLLSPKAQEVFNRLSAGPTATPAAPAATPVTKTINGVTYTQDPATGKWFHAQ